MQEKVNYPNYPFMVGALTGKLNFFADDLYMEGIINKDQVAQVDALIKKLVNNAENAAVKFANLMGE